MRSAQEKKTNPELDLFTGSTETVNKEGMASDFCVPHLHLFFFLLQYKQ